MFIEPNIWEFKIRLLIIIIVIIKQVVIAFVIAIFVMWLICGKADTIRKCAFGES